MKTICRAITAFALWASYSIAAADGDKATSKPAAPSSFEVKRVATLREEYQPAPDAALPQNAPGKVAACRWTGAQQEDPLDESAAPNDLDVQDDLPDAPPAAPPAPPTPPPAVDQNNSVIAEPVDPSAAPTSAPPAPVALPAEAGAASASVPGCVGTSCCAPCRTLDCCSWIAGGEATFLWGNFNRSGVSLSTANSQFSSNDPNAGSVDNSMIVAPRVWLGVQGPKWGFVARYWNASVSDFRYDPRAPLSGVNFAGFDRFNAYLFDFEAQRLFYSGCWSHRMGFGVRYGSVNLDTNGTLSSLGVSSLATATALSSQQFNGTGLTWGLFSLRPIGDGCWGIYAAPRFSILWGSSVSAAQTGALAADTLGSAGSFNGAATSFDDSLFIAELQWGIQWQRKLSWSPASAFIRFGGEYQYWDTSKGNRGASAGSFASVPTAAALSSSSTNGLLFDLIGFTFGAGVIY